MGISRRRALAGLMFLVLFVVATLAGTDGYWELYTFNGNSGTLFGISVDGAGDVNKDGFDDLIVGACWDNTGAGAGGRACVYSGKDGRLIYSYTGSAYIENLGSSVAGAGDVDKDGYDDFLIGSRGANSAALYSGKTGKSLRTYKGWWSYFGYCVAHAGDVNADGYPDQVIGGHQGNGSAGAAAIYSGKDGGLIYSYTGSSNANLGSSVDGAGDVNKDGYDDVIIGARQDADPTGALTGSALVISGKDGSALYKHYGKPTKSNFGASVAGAGDLDKDGYADYIVGTAKYANYVRAFSGRTGKILYTLEGGTQNERYGFGVCGLGDLNGDGHDDFAVTSALDDTNGTDCGAVFVHSGKDGSKLFSLYGDAGDKLGHSLGDGIACAGDVNGDGSPDLIVGANRSDFANVYVGRNPTGTLVINEDAFATNSTSVTLDLTWKAGQARVTHVRARNAGSEWGPWFALSASLPWKLPDGEGAKSVEVQLRDEAGLLSRVLEDSIILDQTPPVGTVLIDGGAKLTPTPWVELLLEYTDLQSGVTDVRIRNEGASWSAWEYVERWKDWTLAPSGDGLYVVEVQYRDAAGNISEIAADSIEYVADIVPPRIVTVRACGGLPYVCPEEEFRVLVHAIDVDSGVRDFRVICSPGGCWTDWVSCAGGPTVLVPRPETHGRKTVTAQARDQMGNESETVTKSVFFLEASPSWLGAKAKASGVISAVGEIDAFTLGLLEGDALDVRLETHASTAGRDLKLDLDIVSPAGERFVVGGHPEDGAVSSWPVPRSGRYLLVLRVARGNTASSGSYRFKAKVKQAKANRKVKAEFTGAEIPFDAVNGSKFKASLKGDGVEPGDVTLVGPNGPVVVEVSGKPGRVKIRGVVLTAGTGTYTIRLTEQATVTAKWTLKLPKIRGTVLE